MSILFGIPTSEQEPFGFKPLVSVLRDRNLFAQSSFFLHNLPFVNQRSLFMAKVHLQSEPASRFNDGLDCRVENLIVQADLNAVADFVLPLIVGWHGAALYLRARLFCNRGTDTYSDD